MGLRRLLARLLGHRALLDANQRLTVRAVEDIQPACMAGFGDALARLAIDHRVEEDHRARGIIVPEIMVYLLEVPDVLAGLGLQGDHRGTEQVVTLAHRPVMIRTTVARDEVDEPEFRIEGGRVPYRRPTAHRVIGAGRPGVTAKLARSRHRKPSPQNGAGLRVQGGEATPHTILASSDAAINNTVVVEGSAGDGVAVLPLLDGGLPRHLTRLHVQRHDVGVELTEKEQSLAHCQTTIHPAAAEGRDLLVDIGPVFPENRAGLGIEGEDIVVARDDVHDAVLDQRRCLQGVLGTEPGAFETGHPSSFELRDIGGVNLI